MSMNVALVRKGDHTAEIFNDAANIALWEKDGWKLVVPVMPKIVANVAVNIPSPSVTPEIKLDSEIIPPATQKEEATSAPKAKTKKR